MFPSYKMCHWANPPATGPGQAQKQSCPGGERWWEDGEMARGKGEK